MTRDLTNTRSAKPVWLTIVLLLLYLFDGYALAHQKQRCKDVVVTPRRSVSRVAERPQLSADYSQVAKFKLISRKKTYHFGEIISLDLAFLNTSGAKLFFREFSDHLITLEVRDEKENAVKILPYDISLEGLVADSYILVEPDSIITWTYQLLAGCQGTKEIEKFWEVRKTFNDDMSTGRLKFEKERFDRDLFANFGLACLDTLNPGVYTITATAANDYVIISPCEGNPKTAVGKISSTPLKITIVP